MIGNGQSFYLQIYRDECICCEDVEQIEEEFFAIHESLFIYELDLSRSRTGCEQAKEYLQTLFPEFTSLPGVFVIENGKERKRLEYSDDPEILKQRLEQLFFQNP